MRGVCPGIISGQGHPAMHADKPDTDPLQQVQHLGTRLTVARVRVSIATSRYISSHTSMLGSEM